MGSAAETTTGFGRHVTGSVALAVGRVGPHPTLSRRKPAEPPPLNTCVSPSHRSEGTQLPSSPRASPEPDTKSSEPEKGGTRSPDPAPEGAWGSNSSPASRPPDQGLSCTPRALSALMPPSGLQTEPHPLPAELGLPQPPGAPSAGLRADTLWGRVGSRGQALAQRAETRLLPMLCRGRAGTHGAGVGVSSPSSEVCKQGWLVTPREGHKEAHHVKILVCWCAASGARERREKPSERCAGLCQLGYRQPWTGC